MRRTIMSSLLLAGALTGVSGYAGASTESTPGVAMGETSQQKGHEILFGRIEKIEGDSYSIRGHDGQFMNLQLTKDSNIVCISGSDAKLMTGLKGVVGSTDEAANRDVARGSGFVVGSSDCHFKPGDLVRIEASDMGRITTIASLPYDQEGNGSQVATEKDEELTTSTQ